MLFIDRTYTKHRMTEFYTLEPNIHRTLRNWNWKMAEGQNY